MFGFSIPKLLVLFLIILLVWYGFKFIERQNHLSKDRKKKPKRESAGDSSKFQKDEVEDLVKCPKCGNYFSPGSSCTICMSE